jgi:2-phosphoglycerate kinase
MVRCGAGTLTPFSRGEHQQRLESCGVPADEAARVTRTIYEHLMVRKRSRISLVRLARLTYICLKRMSSDKHAHNYLVWTDFVHSGRPLFILIGGTAGSGKSTIATEVAGRLDIVRSQSTDMLREVMRVMIPEKLMPVLHASTFDAWRTLRATPDDKSHEAALLRRGFRTQAELVAVSCEAVLKRAAQERVSVVLEGVHVRPDLLECVPKGSDAIVVPVVLAISNREKLEQRIRGRGHNVPLRRAERYLKNLDAIWSLQTVLLDEADKAGVSIIANDDKSVAVREVMAAVIDAISEEFGSTPAKVFGEASERWEAEGTPKY